MLKLCEFENESEYSQLYSFMSPLWHETYGEILPREQIDLLLKKYFSEDGIKYFRTFGYKYYDLTDGVSRLGVVVICKRDGTTYLDKLYLLPSARGRGCAEFVFSELLRLFDRDITLNVNQANTRAVRCYLKNGFEIESEEKIVLGEGMVNIDYRMRLKKRQL